MQMGADIENFGELFGVLLGEQLGAKSEKFGELFGACGPPQAWPHVTPSGPKFLLKAIFSSCVPGVTNRHIKFVFSYCAKGRLHLIYNEQVSIYHKLCMRQFLPKYCRSIILIDLYGISSSRFFLFRYATSCLKFVPRLQLMSLKGKRPCAQKVWP